MHTPVPLLAAIFSPGYIINGMSAAEIIEQIKQLPPEDKQAVHDFVMSPEFQSSGPVQYIPEDQFMRAAEEIFDKYDNLFRKLAQ